MRAYLMLRRWVDGCWSEHRDSRVLVLLAGVPFILVPVLGRWWLVPSILIVAVWIAFVGWRGSRMARASDVHYDRRTKFLLAREYRSSESAMKTSFRKKRRRRA